MEAFNVFGKDINNNMYRKGRKNRKFSKNLLQLTFKNLIKICNTRVCLQRLSEKEIRKWQTPKIAVKCEGSRTAASGKNSDENDNVASNSVTNTYEMDICQSSEKKNSAPENNLKNDVFKTESITHRRFQNAKTKKIKTALIKAYQDEVKENEIKLETPPKSPNEQPECHSDNDILCRNGKMSFPKSNETLKSEENDFVEDTYLTPAETEGSITENDIGDSDESLEHKDIVEEKQITTGIKCDECKLVARNSEMLLVHKRIMHNLIKRQSEKLNSDNLSILKGKGNDLISNQTVESPEQSKQRNNPNIHKKPTSLNKTVKSRPSKCLPRYVSVEKTIIH